MIRLLDATVLAYTKLRVHRIRTGLAVGIAGLLFGLLAAVVMIVQGVFSSVDRFSSEGLNNRAIVDVTRSGGMTSFSEYEHRDDPAFVGEVEAAYKNRIETKQTAAKQYGIPYNPGVEDPSPITIDTVTKQKVIAENSLSSIDVQAVASVKRQAEYKPFDIQSYLQPYRSAKVIQPMSTVLPQNGSLAYMKDGKEANDLTKEQQRSIQMFGSTGPGDPILQIIDSSLTGPFITNHSFDPSKGEIPVIVPYSVAEKLLGYEKFDASATSQDKLQRMTEVRKRIGEVTASFCYRNTASSNLMAQAAAQQKEIAAHANDKDYIKPKIIYKLPAATDCGPVTIESDTRTATERKADENRALYEQAIGEYLGEPAQQKVVVRGVGVSSDAGTASQAWSITEFVKSMFGSWLGYGTWSIPSDLLNQLPESARPASIFHPSANTELQGGVFRYEAYLVEFQDESEARSVLQAGVDHPNDNVFSRPFGSGVLFVDEAKQWFDKVFKWVFIVVGVVAMLILAGIVGRSVSEGRRESSIFRAIGASRKDIGVIYGVYTLLLCARIAIFAAIMGLLLAGVVELLTWRDATYGARLAYAASDTDKTFHLFSLASPYLLWIVATIVAAGILASIIPILLGARRNPIKDMRNDT